MSTDIVQKASAPRGFDSPVATREGDHLNRWPLAREVFGIATTGPKNWSVRIGIYGEWGTGKTSVLKFIESMASQERHVVVWFDPWEHSAKDSLWRAFVLTVFDNLERRIGAIPGAKKAKSKAWMAKAKRVVGAVASIANDNVGKVTDAGLDLVKKHFSFSKADLSSLQEILGDRRVIVLIDDLDRTAPELVPEILFALKELMDIPAFSFVCAFDPIVVGEVLGTYHPGFGEGLKFLDKIIDYPRWLPPASSESLANLAVTEAARSCSYVPETAIRDAVPLLPKNPRAIRQFIRLLTLLKPQIERHYAHELNWPVILTSNILKIRHPRLAHELLNAREFWSSIQVVRVTSHDQDEENSLKDAVVGHIQTTYANIGLTPGQAEAPEKEELKTLLLAICSHVGIFSGLDEQGIAYQTNVAEAPTAVTWKEFDLFLSEWRSNPVTSTAKAWIAEHANGAERDDRDVYRELLSASIRRYAQALHQADNVFSEAERPPIVRECTSLLALINVLVFDLGHIDQPNKQIGDAEFDLLIKEWARFAGANLQVHKDFWPRNEALILALFERWGPDVTPLVRVLSPYSGICLRDFDGAAARDFHKKLCAIALPKFANQILAAFRESGFVERVMHNEGGMFDTCCMIWDAQGPLWGLLRGKCFGVLAEASSNRTIQANAHGLLRWFVLKQEGHGAGDQRAMRALFSDQEVFDAVWNAAVAKPLGPRAVYDLMRLPSMAQTLGIKCALPSWWQPIVSTFLVPAAPEVPRDALGETGSLEELR